MKRLILRHCVALICVVSICSSVTVGQVSITVSGNGIARTNSVATIDLPVEYNQWTGVRVAGADGRFLAQLSSDVPRRLFVLIDKLGANETAILQVRQAPAATKSGVKIVDEDGGYVFKVGERTALRYNHAMVESPEGLDPVYRRSGQIHPLFSPSGKIVTDDFCPTDHTHQHGVMFAWTNCSFEGRDVNFWEQQRRQAIVRHASTISLIAGPVFGEMVTKIDHIDITSGAEKPVLSEQWRLRVYNVSGDHFVFDLHSEQSCVADSPLTINKYHYGGMAIRGNRTWAKENSGFVTSNGRSRADGNHDRPNWCDMSGIVDGEHAGVTLYCHPNNFRAPQPVRLHPSMPYFCYAPLVLGEFKIEPHTPLVSAYRFVSHDDRVESSVANAIWQDYAHPITVSLVNSP